MNCILTLVIFPPQGGTDNGELMANRSAVAYFGRENAQWNGVLVMQIEPQIRQYLAENFLFSDNGYELEDEASFLEEGIVDSTGVLELVMFMEETLATIVR